MHGRLVIYRFRKCLQLRKSLVSTSQTEVFRYRWNYAKFYKTLRFQSILPGPCQLRSFWLVYLPKWRPPGLYVNLPAPLSDSAFLFVDDVKMVFPLSQSSQRLSSFSSAWTWAGKWDLSVNPNKTALLGTSHPFLRIFLRQTPIIKSPRLPTSETWRLPLTQLSPHGREAGKTARRLLFTSRRSFFGLCISAFYHPVLFHSADTPSACKGTNPQTLRADINQMDRVYRLHVTCHMRKGFVNSTSSH